MEGNLAILEGNFDWVPGKKHIFFQPGLLGSCIEANLKHFE